MTNIKVSICVPVYGAEKFMEKCARSLFEQTYHNIEYVFVNDCTPDRSIEIIRQVLLDYPQRQASVKMNMNIIVVSLLLVIQRFYMLQVTISFISMMMTIWKLMPSAVMLLVLLRRGLTW